MRLSGLSAFAALAAWFGLMGAAPAPRPVVVELYTSQGCAACLKANQTANQLAARDDLLVLALPVDYWDYLGWKDTLARPAFAARQRAYVRRLRLRGVSSPQMIVDGAAQASGANRTRIDGLVASARKAQGAAPQMLFRRDGRLAVGSGRAPKAGADVWLVRFDPRPRRVAVRKGENRGKTVIQRNVVRQLVRLGEWRGSPAVYRLPQGRTPTLRTYVLLQQRGGKILGVLAEPPKPVPPPPEPEPVA